MFAKKGNVIIKHSNLYLSLYKCLDVSKRFLNLFRLTFCHLLFRFYLGGPTSVRGFGMYSIGPQSEGESERKRAIILLMYPPVHIISYSF